MSKQAVSQLESVIQELKIKLSIYAQKANASELYIYRQNQLIKHLIDIYNDIPQLQHEDIWQQIESEIEVVFEKDSELSGVCIKIRFNDRTNNYALINL